MCQSHIYIIQILKMLKTNTNNINNYKLNTLKQAICNLNWPK